jgi:thiosulfate/3-mercaptopyruvate sulfurtransferase
MHEPGSWDKSVVFTTLIDTDTLAAHLTDPLFAVIDCRSDLHDSAWGEQEYSRQHIPGATYASLERDLSGPTTGRNGRHPLPDPESLARTLSRHGVTSGVQVVAYDQSDGRFASRLWWLLRWLGHDASAVLDGGFARWGAEGRAVRSGIEAGERREFTSAPRPGWVVSADEISTLLGRPDWRLVDARAPERYRGEIEPLDRLPGHIPGALNHFFEWNVTENGVWRRPDDIRTRFQHTLGPVPPERIISYCGSGVTACHNLLALELAGLHGARLYPGSWSEWSSDPTRPVERS